MTEQRETHRVEVAGCANFLCFRYGSGVRIAVVNILGDTELTQYAAKELAKQLADRNLEVLVTRRKQRASRWFTLSPPSWICLIWFAQVV
ncbi:MAG: hypothetical protein KF726_05150 [Anaerolineae bacterium]|nr:hypothetical protein [Anaerolineae bacterium]